MQIIPLTDAFGAEIVGVDLSEELGHAAFDQIERAFNEHSVLLFRDQRITDQQHVHFSRRFGELEVHVLKEFVKPEFPQIYVLSNIVNNGKPVGIKDAGNYWHSRGRFIQRSTWLILARPITSIYPKRFASAATRSIARGLGWGADLQPSCSQTRNVFARAERRDGREQRVPRESHEHEQHPRRRSRQRAPAEVAGRERAAAIASEWHMGDTVARTSLQGAHKS